MTSTQRSEGMNYVFKKRFHRKLGISELLVECDKVMASLRANELDEDFRSSHKDRVPYIPNLPMLKTTDELYTRRIYSEFKIEFKDQFLFSGTMLKTEGSISTYMVDRGRSVHSRWIYSLLLEVDQDATSVVRQLRSDGVPNNKNMSLVF
jgi:hypothetical protein